MSSRLQLVADRPQEGLAVENVLFALDSLRFLAVDNAEYPPAEFRLGNNDLDRAIRSYNRALDLDPGYTAAIRNRNICIRSQAINKNVLA